MSSKQSKIRAPRFSQITVNKLLDKVIKIVTENPERLAMRVVMLRGTGIDRFSTRVIIKKPACGTVGCIAGWCDYLLGHTSRNTYNPGNFINISERLGLSYRQADELFLPGLTYAYDQQSPDHVRAVITHIRAFQAKYADQLNSTVVARKVRTRTKSVKPTTQTLNEVRR